VSLRARIERLEAERARGVVEIVRLHHGGVAPVTVVCNGRVVSRRGVTPEEAGRVAVGITIRRTYGGRADAA
jgi:hypothetical protein